MLKFAWKLAAAATVLAGVALGTTAQAQDGQKTFYL
ncbi:ABC transporter substrate-binding protein, partial [Mesorhizobium sp. M8A.F.Ca.ET.059.01.1.1]